MARNSSEAAVFIGAGCLGMIVLYVILMLLSALVIMIGWNMSMPDIFGLKQIDISEAFGLSLLAGALAAPRMAATSKA